MNTGSKGLSPFVSCVNNHEVLQKNLLRSPDVAALGVRTYENQRSAARAYNDALAKAGRESEFTVFVHQDIYLPEGWLDRLKQSVSYLHVHDPSWAVLGCIGVSHEGQFTGHVYSNGHGVLGTAFARPIRIRTLDEIVLVVRHIPDFRFTDSHPGFHMYGTDICLRAEQLGLGCYVISDYCVHNGRFRSGLPWAFYSGCRAIVEHFPHALPVKAPCAVVSRPLWPMRVLLLRQLIARLRGRVRVVESLRDPATALYRIGPEV